MDPRIPEFHAAVCRLLVDRSAGLLAAHKVLTSVTSEELTEATALLAIDLIEADLPSPLRATAFDLARLLAGTLPCDDLASPPPAPLKLHRPED